MTCLAQNLDISHRLALAACAHWLRVDQLLSAQALASHRSRNRNMCRKAELLQSTLHMYEEGWTQAANELRRADIKR